MFLYSLKIVQRFLTTHIDMNTQRTCKQGRVHTQEKAFLYLDFPAIWMHWKSISEDSKYFYTQLTLNKTGHILKGAKKNNKKKKAESCQLHEVIQQSSSNRQCVICNYQMHAQTELDVHTQSTIRTTSPCSPPGVTALHWTFLGTNTCINKKLHMSVQTYLQKH